MYPIDRYSKPYASARRLFGTYLYSSRTGPISTRFGLSDIPIWEEISSRVEGKGFTRTKLGDLDGCIFREVFSGSTFPQGHECDRYQEREKDWILTGLDRRQRGQESGKVECGP